MVIELGALLCLVCFFLNGICMQVALLEEHSGLAVFFAFMMGLTITLAASGQWPILLKPL